MKEQLIDFETAKLAKGKGFDEETLHFYTKPNSKMFGIDEHSRTYPIKNTSKKLYTCGEEAALNTESVFSAPTQSLLQKYIREERGVLICIYRNASGYLWSIDKNDGGTGLGWSDYRSNEKDKGGFTSFEFALEDILYLSLLKTLEEFQEDEKEHFHWGNYADYLIEQSKL